jgi:site-specific recombinase XerD
VERKVDPFHASLADIINFLSSRFEEGLEYATLNGYRSALSAYHPEIEGFKVGQHPRVKQFLAGVFNVRPPLPRYTETWDVNTVLEYIQSLGENSHLNDKNLTQKLVMLIALTNVTRAHEIQGLDLKYVEDHGEKIIFHIPGLTKTKRPGNSNKEVILQEYEEEKTLDVVDCFRHYIGRTKTWRDGENKESQLFLSLVFPHNPVTSSTISRWLKDIMCKAGIDTEKFKAHSVRGAATSKAMQGGMSVEQILEKANWSNAKTFYRFYYKSVNKDIFQMKVFAQ